MIDRDLQRSAAVISTLFAALFLGLLTALVHNKLAISYVVTLILSGVIYAIFGWRIVGLLHGALMLCIAGLMLYVILFTVRRPQADDPAAGIIAWGNVVLTIVCLVVGTVAALCGIGVVYSTLPRAQKDGEGE